MIPSAAYRIADSEFSRHPVEVQCGRMVTVGGAVAATGGTFLIPPAERLVTLGTLALRVQLTANAASETRLIRARVMIVGTAGEDRGAIWEHRVSDVAGVGLRGDYGNALALAANAAGEATWSLAFAGMILPTSTRLRFQTFTGGGVPQLHTTEVQWLIGIVPRGTIVS